MSSDARKRFNTAFPRGKAFLPVIHCRGFSQTLKNARIAFREGADGIFLIGHGLPAAELTRIYTHLRLHFARQWIGINFLDLEPLEVLGGAPATASALWMDDVGVREDAAEPDAEAKHFFEMRQAGAGAYSGPVFGGVAFKYQHPPTKNLARAAQLAMPYADVITTSGPATGKPPSVEKIRAMREAIGDHPLANASGLTITNASQYREYVDAALVGTSITDEDGVLIPWKVYAFRRRWH